MTLDPPIQRLQFALSELIALEIEIQRSFAGLHDDASAHQGATDLLIQVNEMASGHLDALCARMQIMPGDASRTHAGIERLSATHGKFGEIHPVSSALGVVYAILQKAIIRYSTIQTIALRAQDSWVIADEGTTAHIARRHTQEYMGVAGQIIAMIHDVVVWELEADGLFCRCTCPSCSIGICVGPISSRSLLSEAWIAARPPLAEHGIELKPPRPGSAAAKADFLPGDMIVAIDGEKIDSHQLLQRGVRDHEDGDWMEFTVRRNTGEAQVTVVHRRDGNDINEDECILPAGQEFYLDQARGVKRRLRKKGNGNPTIAAVNGASNGAPLSNLSAREIQVLGLVAQGATNPMVAAELEISRATVARHVASILAKTGLANRTEAAALAARQGLLASI